MSERIKRGGLSRFPKRVGEDGWCYESNGGLEVYSRRQIGPTNRVGMIPLRTIKAYLKRREAMP